MIRVAIVSDIHGNRTAFEAVLADLRQTSPDLILHGGDLADSGSSPVDIVDTIRELGWQGVAGNTDEMLFDPQSLAAFGAGSPHLADLFGVIAEMAAATREALGGERLAWLRELPRRQIEASFALVHASSESLWRAPGADASDAELEPLYSPLGRPIAIYGHIHCSYARSVGGMMVANTGSVGLSYDGDRRAAYLLLDDSKPVIRRVEYDLARELKVLAGSKLPHADWVARILESARPQLP